MENNMVMYFTSPMTLFNAMPATTIQGVCVIRPIITATCLIQCHNISVIRGTQYKQDCSDSTSFSFTIKHTDNIQPLRKVEK